MAEELELPVPAEPAPAKRKRLKKEYDASLASKLAATDGVSLATNPDTARGMLHQLLNAIPSSPLVEEARKLITPADSRPPIDLGATIYPDITREFHGQVVTDKWLVCLIGAGGVGARLAPLLVKHLTAGDVLHVIDGDLVEAKNITRQHFTPDDIGVSKAQVVAQRARATAPREGVEVGFSSMFLDDSNILEVVSALSFKAAPACEDMFGEGWGTPSRSTLLVTAVDTLATRKLIRDTLLNFWNSAGIPTSQFVNSFIWVDCGNAMTSGQAMVMMLGSPRSLTVSRPGTAGGKWHPGAFMWECWREILPGFLDREDAAPANPGADNCAIRIDPQTVLANSWAALAAASIVIPILSMSGIRTAGVGFSVTGVATTAPVSEKVWKGVGSPEFRLVSRKLS